ncbi:MAG: hypothetical protein FD180_1360 [Planctomycetota bacterium]|nr:MAG: hypothetical protein FD180_1360 [Planctomycetota bacterium]
MKRALLLAAVVLAAGTARADLITLKDGRVIEGDVISDDGKVVKVKLRMGALTIEKDKIVSIEEKLTPEQEYAERLKKLDENDAKSQFELAEWAESVKLEKEAIRHFIAAATLDPEFKAASEELASRDWHLVSGEWQDPDTYYPGRGWVRFEGRWTHPLEYSWRLSQQIRKKMDERLASARAAAAREHNARERAVAARDAAGRAIVARTRERADTEAAIPDAEADVKGATRSRDRAERLVESAQFFYNQERLRAQRGEPNAAGQADLDLRQAKKSFALADFDLSQAERKVTDLEKRSAALSAAIDAAEAAEVKAEKDEKAAADAEAEALAGMHELEQMAAAAKGEEEKAKSEWEKAKPAK